MYQSAQFIFNINIGATCIRGFVIITIILTVQLLPEGQRIPLQKVSYPDDDDKAEKEFAVIYYRMNYCDFNIATIIKVATGIYVGLIMGEERRNESGKTFHILELQKYFNPISFPSDKAT